MNISKYFDKFSPKRDLRGDSKQEEERKKVRVGITKTNTTNEY